MSHVCFVRTLAIAGLSLSLCGRAAGSDATKPGNDFNTLIVVGLSPLGSVEEDFFFGLYFSTRLARKGVSIEPGFPAGWATSVSLRLIEGADGVFELHDPTGLVRRFVARRSADQWVADDVLILDRGPESGCGGRVLDPEGYVWQFDSQGYTCGLTLPDGSEIRIERDPDSHRLHAIVVEGSSNRPGPALDRGQGERYWQWPALCRWPRPDDAALWLADGRSLHGAPPVRGIPSAATLKWIWDDHDHWTLNDDTGRFWTAAPPSGGQWLILGTVLDPRLDPLASIEWTAGRQVIRGLPAWVFFETPPLREHADPDAPSFSGVGRTRSPSNRPRVPLAQCYPHWVECANSLRLETGCVGCDVPLAWTWANVFYQGRLTWSKRYRFAGGITCTPGNTSRRRVSLTYSVEVALAANIGLDGIGSWETGITNTRSETVEDTWSATCCRWTDEDGRLRQTCKLRLFQAIYPHTLHYRYQAGSMGGWSAWRTVQRRWNAYEVDHLLCCDNCCAR